MKYVLVKGNLVDVFGKKNVATGTGCSVGIDLRKANQLLDINTHLILVTDEEKATHYGELLTFEEAVVKYAELQDGKEKVRELI